VDNGLRSAFRLWPARLTIPGAVLVQDLTSPLNQIPIMNRGKCPGAEFAGLPVAELGGNVLRVGAVADTSTFQHPFAGLSQGCSAGELAIDKFLACNLAFDHTLPILRFAQRFEGLRFVDAIAPYLDPVLVGSANLDSARHRPPHGTFSMPSSVPNRAKKCEGNRRSVVKSLILLERVKGIEPSS
jgi:hypothetical protein